jgi:hypothetical protein
VVKLRYIQYAFVKFEIYSRHLASITLLILFRPGSFTFPRFPTPLLSTTTTYFVGGMS